MIKLHELYSNSIIHYLNEFYATFQNIFFILLGRAVWLRVHLLLKLLRRGKGKGVCEFLFESEIYIVTTNQKRFSTTLCIHPQKLPPKFPPHFEGLPNLLSKKAKKQFLRRHSPQESQQPSGTFYRSLQQPRKNAPPQNGALETPISSPKVGPLPVPKEFGPIQLIQRVHLPKTPLPLPNHPSGVSLPSCRICFRSHHKNLETTFPASLGPKTVPQGPLVTSSGPQQPPIPYGPIQFVRHILPRCPFGFFWGPSDTPLRSTAPQSHPRCAQGSPRGHPTISRAPICPLFHKAETNSSGDSPRILGLLPRWELCIGESGENNERKPDTPINVVIGATVLMQVQAKPKILRGILKN